MTDKYEYPKIQTLFFRDEKTHKIIEDKITCPEFTAIKKWYVTEKIDGMNVRVFWNPENKTITYDGHKENSQMPKPLLEFLNKTFTVEKMDRQFRLNPAVLFGEGYGPKIQKGGNYREDISFILFDAIIADYWIQPETLEKLAEELEIKYVPVLGTMTLDQIIEFVKSKPKSMISINKDYEMEGVVCRSYPLMLFRKDGTPIMFKLKARDY